MKLTKLLEANKIQESKDLLIESLKDTSGEAFDELINEDIEAPYDAQWELLKIISNTNEDLDSFVLWTLIKNGSYDNLMSFIHTLLDIKDELIMLEYKNVAERHLVDEGMTDYINSKLHGFSISHDDLLDIVHCLEQGGTISPGKDTIFIKRKI